MDRPSPRRPLLPVTKISGQVDRYFLHSKSTLSPYPIMIALGEQGTLVLAEAKPEAYVEKARWQALDGTCWSVPVLANGKLYLRNEKKMLTIDS